jgi:MFS superfamily sulfate permease-like transporter
VVEFFSYPIIAGFTCAASLQIASSQVKGLFGLPGKANAFLEAWEAVFDNIDQIRLWDSVLGILSILFLVALKVLISVETTAPIGPETATFSASSFSCCPWQGTLSL